MKLTEQEVITKFGQETLDKLLDRPAYQTGKDLSLSSYNGYVEFKSHLRLAKEGEDIMLYAVYYIDEEILAEVDDLSDSRIDWTIEHFEICYA